MPGLLREFGVDPAIALGDLGFEIEDLNPETRLPYATILTILERSVSMTGCGHFGLLLGSRHDHTILGAIGKLIGCGGTLRQSLTDFLSWQFRNSRAATVYLQRFGDHYALGYGIYGRHTGSMQIHDLVVAVGCNMLRALTGNRVEIIEVHLAHRTPSNRSVYETVLKAPVLFDQYQTCIVVRRAAMEEKVVGADAGERLRIIGQFNAVFAPDFEEISTLVRRALWPQIFIGSVTMPEIAAIMGLHVRTLRRRLADEGLTFEALKDEVRYSAARELLELTDLPIGEIAAALSFASHSAFDHAFHRFSGSTPSGWRKGAAALAAEGFHVRTLAVGSDPVHR